MCTQLAAEKIVPPAQLAEVEELLSCEGAVQRLMLSADGQPSTSTFTDVGKKFLSVLKNMNKVVGPLLSQHAADHKAGAASDVEKAVAEQLERMGIKPGKGGAAK